MCHCCCDLLRNLSGRAAAATEPVQLFVMVVEVSAKLFDPMLAVAYGIRNYRIAR